MGPSATVAVRTLLVETVLQRLPTTLEKTRQRRLKEARGMKSGKQIGPSSFTKPAVTFK